MYNQNHSKNQLIEPGGLLMFSAKRLGSDDIESHCAWDDPVAMVKRSHEIYSQADYLIHYNGCSFDNKVFGTAWAEQGLGPAAPWRDIDLIKTVRKNFQLPFKSLAYVVEWLGLDHKTDPGGMDTWREILRPTSAEAQREAQQRMVAYCENDVRITEQAFEKLRPWVAGMNFPLSGSWDDEPACTRCGSVNIHARGWAYTTAAKYRRYQCQDCKGWMRAKRSESMVNAELRNV